MTLQDRIDNYVRETGFPRSLFLSEDGRIVGTWIMGNGDTVDLTALPGDTVDINAETTPTYVDDAQTLERTPVANYDLLLVDPPYSVEDCEHYRTTMIKRNRVMSALGDRARSGAHVVWLDQVLPRGPLRLMRRHSQCVASANCARNP